MLIDQLQILTDCLFEPSDVIELRHLATKPVSSWHLASNLHAVCEPIEQVNRTHNCYFGCNPRKGIGQGKAEGVRLARSLCVEWDDTSWPQAWRRIKSAGLPDPTLVIWSGGGPHCYWRLTQPITDLRAWSMYQKAFIRLLGSDGCIHDAPRIMRLPGTWNHKRLTYAKVLWSDPGARYRVDEVLYRVPVVEVEAEAPRMVSKRINLVDRYIRAERYLAKCQPAISGSGGHNQTFSVVRILVSGFGIRGEEALGMLQEWNRRCNPPWSERELRHKIREAETKVHKKAGIVIAS